ncbi:hypothetical protein ACFYS8_11690 [Kitasatospora sp. NPDC004615]|uniref:hypothetical protein n=1 Tax=Kitasatospora sp. NPDC004615 TaxID=3364017 RepID=UPI0036845ACA
MTDPHRPGPQHELSEDQLRDRLHRAVAGVQPEPGALPRLRTAVPRRRAARRRAWGGAAVLAAAVVGLPVVHAAQPFHLSGDPTGGQAAPGATATPDASVAAPGHPRNPAGATAAGPDGAGPETSADPSADSSPGGSPVVVPLCTGTDLGRGEVQKAAAATADGRIYGWFQLTNTAGHPCRITGPGAVTIDPGTIGVRLLAHTVGDPAEALPDPAGLPRELLLTPGGSYLVRFAWVPTGCPTTSPSPVNPQPSPTPSGGAMPGTDTPAGSPPAVDPSPTGAYAPAGHQSPRDTFRLGYTPDPATGFAATTVLPTGCGGTVYHSAPEPAPTTGLPAPSPSAGA